MARLNEPPVSTDSLETLRKKLLRQNRDLAKSNNIRALRIRELENECACMLSENLELRGRILELEKEVEDNDSRRIADHALAIKDKLESQLTEWGILLAGLGLEPPMKRHSPRIRKSAKSRLSFSSARPSPSQRRLRDIAKDIEELGSIAENKSYPRRSMNPEQILALRSEADSVDSPELGPPPISQFIDGDPVKVDSPSQTRSISVIESSPKPELEVSPTSPSPQVDELISKSPSPEKKTEIKMPPQEPKIKKIVLADKPTTNAPLPQPAKAGSKRKLAARDEIENSKPQRTTNENIPPKSLTDKQSIREKAGGRTLKELASIRKEAREKGVTITNNRKPLAAKSINDDMSSPKKNSKPALFDEIAAAKADLLRSSASQERTKLKPKTPISISVETVLDSRPIAPKVTTVDCELGTPLAEAALLSPSSPEPETLNDGSRGATPPPADVNSTREPGRLSRRNRTAVSYAEPNLRDKMRRPRKELYDAVSGEGKYARRSSQADPIAPDSVKVKNETDTDEAWKNLPISKIASIEHTIDDGPASPLAGKGSPENLPTSVVTDRRRRTSTVYKDVPTDEHGRGKEMEPPTDQVIIPNSSNVDVYEFDTSSPQQAKQENKRKPAGRKGPRRMSAVQNEELPIRERTSSRRRSMMI